MTQYARAWKIPAAITKRCEWGLISLKNKYLPIPNSHYWGYQHYWCQTWIVCYLLYHTGKKTEFTICYQFNLPTLQINWCFGVVTQFFLLWSRNCDANCTPCSVKDGTYNCYATSMTGFHVYKNKWHYYEGPCSATLRAVLDRRSSKWFSYPYPYQPALNLPLSVNLALRKLSGFICISYMIHWTIYFNRTTFNRVLIKGIVYAVVTQRDNSFILAFQSLAAFETSKLPELFYIKGSQSAVSALLCYYCRVIHLSFHSALYCNESAL